MRIALIGKEKVVELKVLKAKKSDLKTILKDWNKEHPDEIMDSVVDLKGKHICKYCGTIVGNTVEDLLCDSCREVFGHAYYSEL